MFMSKAILSRQALMDPLFFYYGCSARDYCLSVCTEFFRSSNNQNNSGT